MFESGNKQVVIAAIIAVVLFQCAAEKADARKQEKAPDTISGQVDEKKDPISTDLAKVEFDIPIEGYKASPLGQAVFAGDTAGVKDLVDEGTSIEDCLTDETYIYDILYAALVFNKVDVARYVLNNKLYTSANETYTEEGETPLTLACALENQNNALEIAERLVALGADVNGAGESGGEYTLYPIIIAVGKNYIRITKLLLEHGARNDVRNKEGDTPLTLAEKKGYQDIASLLKEH